MLMILSKHVLTVVVIKCYIVGKATMGNALAPRMKILSCLVTQFGGEFKESELMLTYQFIFFKAFILLLLFYLVKIT